MTPPKPKSAFYLEVVADFNDGDYETFKTQIENPEEIARKFKPIFDAINKFNATQTQNRNDYYQSRALHEQKKDGTQWVPPTLLGPMMNDHNWWNRDSEQFWIIDKDGVDPELVEEFQEEYSSVDEGGDPPHTIESVHIYKVTESVRYV